MLKLVCTLLVSLCIIDVVAGHARFIEPPSRASMWRYGFTTPPDYNDNEGFCGGRERLMKNGGKCGICGDPYDATIKPHEVGGKYATGQIVKNYQVGQSFTARIEVTANHKGYFEFRICANNNVNSEVTQDCLNRNILPLANGSGYKYFVDSTNGIKEIQLRLPSTIVCSHCVIQWRYRTGNNWGTDPDGTSCIGCGPQEEYYACSDVSIGGSDRPRLPIKTTPIVPRPPNPAQRPTKPINEPATGKFGKCYAIGKSDKSLHAWCSDNCARGNCPDTLCKCRSSIPLPVPNMKNCLSYGTFKSGVNDVWCKTNCQLGNCPSSHCKC